MTEVQKQFDPEDFKHEIAADIATYAGNVHGDIRPDAIKVNIERKEAIETKIADAIADNPALYEELLGAVKTAVFQSPSVTNAVPTLGLCPPLAANIDKVAKESLYYTFLTNVLGNLAVKSQCETKDAFDENAFRRIFAIQAAKLTNEELLADTFSVRTKGFLTTMAVILADALHKAPDSREKISETVKDILNRVWRYKVLGKNPNAYYFVLETAIGLLADKVAGEPPAGEKEGGAVARRVKGVKGKVKGALKKKR